MTDTTIYAPDPNFTGVVAGTNFTSGQAVVSDAWLLNWFLGRGYGTSATPKAAKTVSSVPSAYPLGSVVTSERVARGVVAVTGSEVIDTGLESVTGVSVTLAEDAATPAALATVEGVPSTDGTFTVNVWQAGATPAAADTEVEVAYIATGR